MLDFDKLRTPPDHGDVLVVPEAERWISAAQANAKRLASADVPLLGSTLADWRRKTRAALTGDPDQVIVVTGHQPAFIHPGVWAKHVVARRFADAANGVALNLVVDNDVPKTAMLTIPVVGRNGVGLEHVAFAEFPPQHSFEQIPRQSRERIAEFERAIGQAMGDRFESSQMARFCRAAASVKQARDWVDQAVAGRRAVEAGLGITVEDRRVSEVCAGPLLADMVSHAERFAGSYNRALAAYRRDYRVRGAQRPIPDLAVDGDHCEVPIWAQRHDGPRMRLFVGRRSDTIRLFAGEELMGEIGASRFDSSDIPFQALGDWRLRPRALTLTLWARLLLADLFVHGIGGAKYDRISDAIMADYYGLTPPHMACVSATLHLDLPVDDVTELTVRNLHHLVRDMQCNPQRHIVDWRSAPDPALASFMARRADAVKRSEALRAKNSHDHRARRAVFTEIRAVNQALLAHLQPELHAARKRLADARAALQRRAVERGREYFFGLYDRPRLEQLMAALPAPCDFGV